jgi:hypothetical protein
LLSTLSSSFGNSKLPVQPSRSGRPYVQHMHRGIRTLVAVAWNAAAAAARGSTQQQQHAAAGSRHSAAAHCWYPLALPLHAVHHIALAAVDNLAPQDSHAKPTVQRHAFVRRVVLHILCIHNNVRATGQTRPDQISAEQRRPAQSSAAQRRPDQTITEQSSSDHNRAEQSSSE